MLVRRKEILSVSLRSKKISTHLVTHRVRYYIRGSAIKHAFHLRLHLCRRNIFCHLHSPHYSALFRFQLGQCHSEILPSPPPPPPPPVCPIKNCFATAFHIKICFEHPIKSKFIPTSTSACILSIYNSRPLIYVPLCYKW